MELIRMICGFTIGWIVGWTISQVYFNKLEINRLKKELAKEKLKLEILNIIYK